MTFLKLPYQVKIDSFGLNEGFGFAGMLCAQSLLALPSSMRVWNDVSNYDFAFDEKIDFLILGSGRNTSIFPPELKAKLRALGISSDIMPTLHAKATYNVLLEERRLVAGAFLFP